MLLLLLLLRSMYLAGWLHTIDRLLDLLGAAAATTLTLSFLVFHGYKQRCPFNRCL